MTQTERFTFDKGSFLSGVCFATIREAAEFELLEIAEAYSEDDFEGPDGPEGERVSAVYDMAGPEPRHVATYVGNIADDSVTPRLAWLDPEYAELA